MDLLRRKHQNILFHVVAIGDQKIRIPVAQLGSGDGKTVLITGGLDGDEYAGIEAAYALIDQYTKTKFEGKLTIIPIVNISGFESAVSWNPLDKKYPKHIFPGKQKGSSTQQLMYWLSTNFVQNIDIWIDLHGGASTEILAPYIDVSDTSRKKPQIFLLNSLQNVKAERIILSKTKFTETITKRDVAYIRLESGQLGQRNKKDIKQHIDWVKQVLDEKSPKKNNQKTVYTEVREFLSEKEGIWVVGYEGKTVRKNMLLGEIRSFDGKILQKVIAKENGIFLWRREAMSCKKGDSLYAYAHSKEKIEIRISKSETITK